MLQYMAFKPVCGMHIEDTSKVFAAEHQGSSDEVGAKASCS